MERYRGVFVFVFTLVAMTILGSWLAWVRDTGRWHYLAVYFVGLSAILWKFRGYRPD